MERHPPSKRNHVGSSPTRFNMPNVIETHFMGHCVKITFEDGQIRYKPYSKDGEHLWPNHEGRADMEELYLKGSSYEYS